MRLFRVAVIAMTVIASGCGGGGVNIRPVTGDRTLPALVQVAGDFNVPSGTTATAGGPLTIVASGTARIDGRLALPAGSAFAIFANSIVIRGSIVKYAVRAPSGRVRRQDGSIAATAPDVMVGNNIEFRDGAQIKSDAGRPLHVATTGNGARVTIVNVDLRLPNGADASAAGGRGQDGAGLEIGTKVAESSANAVAPTGTTVSVVPPSILLRKAGIFAGRGGQGTCDRTGAILPQTIQYFLAGDGGAGGSIAINAAEVLSTDLYNDSLIKAGSGGRGGSIGGCYDSDNRTFLSATPNGNIDGVNAGKGLDLQGFTGKGGPGGSVVSSANIPLIANTEGGEGGDSGTLRARAGNGAQATGGKGGDTAVRLGEPGVGGSINGKPAPNGGVTVLLGDGGNGASSGSVGVDGGNGGDVTLNFGAIPGPSQNVDLRNYANGGKGFNGCPNAKGSNGGRGGNVSAGARATYTNVANGGDGGDGSPLGLGGAAGGDLITFRPIGIDGAWGFPCPSPGVPSTPGPTSAPPSTPSPAPPPTSTPTPAPTPTPSPSATPKSVGALIVTPTLLVFSAPNQTKTFTAQQDGFTGNFTAQLQCPSGGSGALTPTSAPGPIATFSLTSLTSGVCSLPVTGGGGQTVTLKISF